MSMKTIRRALSVALLLIGLCAVAAAQEFRGSITGRVTDPNGAVVNGASVDLTKIDTNDVANTTTNAEGSYSFPIVMPGKYKLVVTMQGFKVEVREGVEIRVADKLTLDVQLQTGSVAETVTVTAVQPLETGNVTTGITIERRQIAELPLSEGTAYQLATLAPGVVYTGNPMFSAPISNGNLAAFRVNGAPAQNQITLDGSPNYAFDFAVGFSPPADAVQEFKVQTNVFDAQQGYSAGGTVNVAVKSGTNDFHGSVYYFNRDRSRTANNFFSNRSSQVRPIRTYHRFGGVINGPVHVPGVYDGKDKTFFLFSYERLLDNTAEPQLFSVPTAKMRNGDFTELLGNTSNVTNSANTIIYNPFSGTTSGSNVVRTSFGCPTSGAIPAGSTCNIIPSSFFNPIAVALLKYYPLPNVAGISNGTQNNYFSNVIRHETYRAWLTRIDHKISDKQSIFGKYYHSFNPEDRYDWAADSPNSYFNGVSITQGFEDRTNDGGNIDYTNLINSTTVFDLRGSFNKFTQERHPASELDPASLGFSAAALAAFRGYQYFPMIEIRNLDAVRPIRANLGSMRSDWNLGRLRPFMMGSIQPTVTKTFGNHTAKFGYDWRVVRENFISNGYQGSRLFFDGLYTAPASNSSTALRNAYGRDIAAFLLGTASSGSGSTASQLDNSINYSVQSLYNGMFFHDDWRVTPKLTLNLGLRYELEGGLTERYNRIQRGFDLSTPTPIEQAVRAAYTTAYNANPSNFLVAPANFNVRGGYTYAATNNNEAWTTDKGNWEPRLGISYAANEKTVLRGGFGIFMAPHQSEIQALGLQQGFAGNTPFIASNNNGLTFAGTLSNPFPTGALPSPGNTQGLLTSTGIAVGTQDAPALPVDRQNAKFARVVAGVQRELPAHFVVEANYISAWGYDMPVSRNVNFVPRSLLGTDVATDTAANTLLSATITNPFKNLLPSSSPLNSANTITKAQSILPFPQFNDLWIQEYTGSNRYNALQIQVQQRFSKNLTFTASYTRSHLTEKTTYLNPSDTVLEDRISPDDRPDRFTTSVVYLLPFGKSQRFGRNINRWANVLIGGWQLNGTYEWQSGEPFTLSPTQVWYYGGDVNQITTLTGQGNGQGQIYGVDISAFQVPLVNGAGVVRLNNFNTGIRNVPTTLDSARNQPFLNVNLSLSKSFKFGETTKLQLRAEAINAFNHPYFGSGIGLDPSNAGTFGIVTTQRNNPRDIQFGAKFVF